MNTTIHSVDLYIADKLTEYRCACGKSQQEIAIAIGLSTQQIQKYESRQNAVPIRRLYEIAEYLAIPVTKFLPPSADLSTDNPIPNGIEPKEWMVVKRSYSKIADPEQRKKARDILKAYAGDNRFCPRL